MFRAYWRRPRFWIWWFKRGAPSEVRLGLGLLGVVAVLGGGYLAADRLSAASADSSGAAYTFLTTVERNVTVREHGRTLVKRLPVVHQIGVRPQTIVETRFRSGPGHVVTNRVVRYVPVVKTHVVTTAGRTRLVDQTVRVPTVSTQTTTITRSQTIVNPTTSTVVTAVETTVPVTVKQTATATVVSTQKLPPETVTEPTHTVTVTRTVTDTVTSPSVTVSTPVATLTITVPKP